MSIALTINEMMKVIIRELIIAKKENEITSEQALTWARRVEVQRSQKSTPRTNKANKKLTTVKETNTKANMPDQAKLNTRETLVECMYCIKSQIPRRSPAHGKKCSRFRKVNHIKIVCRIKSKQTLKRCQKAKSCS